MTSSVLADLAEFVEDHRPHGTLTADATVPAWNGYGLTVTCHAVSCSSCGSRQTTPSSTCPTSRG